MQVRIFAKGTNGLPTTTLIADLVPDDLSFTHAALWGPLTATITLAGSLDDAFTIAQEWLGNEVKIYSPDGDWCWEGLIWTISFSYGRRSRRRSLEGYANWIWVAYNEADFTVSPPMQSGVVSMASATDATQVATYGRIEYLTSAGVLSFAAATAEAAAILPQRKRLLWLPESGTLGTDDESEARIDLECYGWYRTLWYRGLIVDTAQTGSADTATAIVNLLATGLTPFISTDTSRLATTGVTAAGSWTAGTTIGEIIKELVGRADGYTFRIDRDRVPVLEADKRLATTPDYLEDTYGTLTNSAGQPVPLWNVVPDRVVRQVDFVPIGALSSAEVDKVSAVYLAETTWRMPGALSFRTAVAGEGGDVEP